MSKKITKPFGRVRQRIVIEADDNKTIRVNAAEIPAILPPGVQALPMDSREMVLCLLKVVSDYTSALFQISQMPEGSPDAKQDSESTNRSPN